MQVDREDRLKAILARKRAAEEAARDAEEVVLRQRAAEQERQDVAKKQWAEVCLPIIQAVASDLNTRTKKGGISIAVEESVLEIEPDIARFHIPLCLDDESTDKELILSVDKLGKIEIVQRIPHNGPRIQADVADLTRDRFEGILLDFLDLTVLSPKKSR